MKRLICGILISFVLTACAATVAETPKQRLFAAQAMFNTHVTIALSYTSQPECTQVLIVACHNAKIKREVINLAIAARSALHLAHARPNLTNVSIAASTVRRLVAYLALKELNRRVTFINRPDTKTYRLSSLGSRISSAYQS